MFVLALYSSSAENVESPREEKLRQSNYAGIWTPIPLLKKKKNLKHDALHQSSSSFRAAVQAMIMHIFVSVFCLFVCLVLLVSLSVGLLFVFGG